MRLSLFMNDDVRENVLKHVRGGSTICATPSQFLKDRRGNTYSSGSQSRGNTATLGRGSPVISRDSSRLTPLFTPSPSDEHLIPSKTFYSLLNGGCYAEELVDNL